MWNISKGTTMKRNNIFAALLIIVFASFAISFSNNEATAPPKFYLSAGLKAGVDNAPYINSVIRKAKEGNTIVWKEGTWTISSPIIQDKTIHWEGVENTVIQATRPTTLLKITGGYKSVISRIKFQGYYSIWDGDKGPTFDGIEVNSLVRMVDCTIRNMWGNGITVSADVHTGHGNASKSKFENLDIMECKGSGMYFQGGDANQCGVYDVDIRDCNGAAILDNSFLGNQFYGCMAHNNKKGSFKASDPNNRSGFYGCYAEGGHEPVYLAGAACWFGGLPSDGIILASPWARVFSYSTVDIKK